MSIEVIFQPEGRRVKVDPGTKLSRAAAMAGIPLELPCGGQGSCGKCRVRIVGEAPEPVAAERRALSDAEMAEGVRLACQTAVDRRMTVEVPTSSRSGAGQILGGSDRFDQAVEQGDCPVRKVFVELPRPGLDDHTPDLDRLHAALGPFEASLPTLRVLPKRLREAEFQGTAVLVEGRLIDFEPGDTSEEAYGLAFDIGSTTLVCALVDLVSGKDVAHASRINPQTRFGDDVISRIQHCREQDEGLTELHDAVVEAINQMIAELCEEEDVSRDRIYDAVFAGNTTMLQIITGITPASLGEVPFVTTFRQGFHFDASCIRLDIHPRGRCMVLPVIGGFVGGDTIAGILVTGLAERPDPVLLFDIGTNGEMVVNRDGEMVAASCAAGPGLEGATMTHGMRATAGAIEEIRIEEDVTYKVIGGVKPVGFCGSGLIDLVAELLRHEILMWQGMITPADALPESTPKRVRDRVVSGSQGAEFVVAWGEETATGNPITLTQHDVRALQFAVAAARSGISTLLKRLEMTHADLERVYVAGAFGNYIRVRNAQRMGLLPSEIDASRFDFIGNASLAGARRLVLSNRARAESERIAQRARHVELARDPDFQNAYVEAMFFPMEPDL